jgi:hypothetical protein
MFAISHLCECFPPIFDNCFAQFTGKPAAGRTRARPHRPGELPELRRRVTDEIGARKWPCRAGCLSQMPTAGVWLYSAGSMPGCSPATVITSRGVVACSALRIQPPADRPRSPPPTAARSHGRPRTTTDFTVQHLDFTVQRVLVVANFASQSSPVAYWFKLATCGIRTNKDAACSLCCQLQPFHSAQRSLEPFLFLYRWRSCLHDTQRSATGQGEGILKNL